MSGRNAFVARYQQHREKIAALPSQRSLGLICDYFKKLPSDPLIWAMTTEQVEDLFLQMEYYHPSEEKQVLRDQEYEEGIEEQKGVLWEDTQVLPYNPAAPPAAPEEGWEELTPDGWAKIR